MSAKQTVDYREGHRQRLRERYAKTGISALADYEVIEMLLCMLISRVDVKPIAKNLLTHFKNLRGILDASEDELLNISGLGKNSVIGLRFIKELISLYHTNELQVGGETISTIEKLIKYFRSKIASEQNEVLEMICFDTKLKIIGETSIRLVEGTVNTANVDIRKIIETAIKCGASSIAIAHNHPSGDPRPSLEDIRFTRKLSSACKPISLNLIEHIIVAKPACYSFRKDGHFDCLYDEAAADRIKAGVADSLEYLI